jgi:hypothetical protein
VFSIYILEDRPDVGWGGGRGYENLENVKQKGRKMRPADDYVVFCRVFR